MQVLFHFAKKGAMFEDSFEIVMAFLFRVACFDEASQEFTHEKSFSVDRMILLDDIEKWEYMHGW